MPRRNTRGPNLPGVLHHVYNRQKNRDLMFMDDEDRRVFRWMIARYLGKARSFDSRGRPYRNLAGHVRLEAFALKGNHFHLALFELRPGGIEALMNGVMTSYVRYFNRRHGADGNMFRGEYRSVPKLGRRSTMNLIAYIHDNHGPDCRCEFCSHRCFVEGDIPGWLACDDGLLRFGGVDNYLKYRRARHDLTDVAGDPLS